MKNFLRSYLGKALLFILCVSFTIVFILSTLGAIFIFENPDLSSKGFEPWEKDIRRSYGQGDAHDLLSRYLSNPTDMSTNDPGARIKDYEISSNKKGILITAYSNGTVKKWDATYYYQLKDPEKSLDFSAISENTKNQISTVNDKFDIYTVKINLDDSYMNGFVIPWELSMAKVLAMLGIGIYIVLVISFIAALLCFIELMCVSARRPNSTAIHPGPLNIVPTDILLVLFFIFCCIPFQILDSGISSDIAIFMMAMFTFIGCFSLALGLSMSIAARIKEKTLIKNTICYRIISFLWKIVVKIHCINKDIFNNLSIMKKVVLIVSLFVILEFMGIVTVGFHVDALLTCWFFEKLIIVPLILYITLNLRKLEISGQVLANGDLNYHTDTDKLIWNFKEHGKNLNNISNGMARAVEERLKSERMKTELITNVSHDIKTPLTSIINYSSLIANEQSENKKITEYAQVLQRQSERLNRLITDLVEVSKANTGNLTVDLLPCDASIFITQASGEYSEKLSIANLNLITDIPDEDFKIMADSRKMWRIFDNLMNNICKYAQPNSRVYLSLSKNKKDAEFIFKNISRDPLNISEEELMERFIRGDSSRNTEGNGLGLAIARSMAEIQGGKLYLKIDGDLFKVIASFPII